MSGRASLMSRPILRMMPMWSSLLSREYFSSRAEPPAPPCDLYVSRLAFERTTISRCVVLSLDAIGTCWSATSRGSSAGGNDWVPDTSGFFRQHNESLTGSFHHPVINGGRHAGADECAWSRADAVKIELRQRKAVASPSANAITKTIYFANENLLTLKIFVGTLKSSSVNLIPVLKHTQARPTLHNLVCVPRR
jgi:hypothetical protein